MSIRMNRSTNKKTRNKMNAKMNEYKKKRTKVKRYEYSFLSMDVSQDLELLEHWNVGILEYWNIGTANDLFA
jgi:hypothetical protein